MRVLCISSPESFREECAPLAPPGVSLERANVAEAIGQLSVSSFDAVLAWFPVEDWTPEEALEEIQRVNPLVPVIIRQPRGSVGDAVRLTKLGAFHYLCGSCSASELALALEAGGESRRGEAPGEEPWRKLLVGESRVMRKVAEIIRLVGNRRSTVLITGETGTGKEMAARAIHMASSRSHLPMVAVNCMAMPENLFEAELFGHVRGAFTGAIGHRVGRFEQAHRSTIFLDEIGEMPLEVQAKLLRVLQEREFQRIGSSETIKVDVRVIAASNADLVERIRQGKFREDLYYRLNVVPIVMPPLRERPGDIPSLTRHFIAKICQQEEIPPKKVGRETLERLAAHSWPGNVRELQNAVEKAVALSGDREMLYPGDFPLPPASRIRPPLAASTPFLPLPEEGLDFERVVAHFERQILDQALKRTGGNKKRAADILRLKRTTLQAKLKSLEGTFAATA